MSNNKSRFKLTITRSNKNTGMELKKLKDIGEMNRDKNYFKIKLTYFVL